MGPGKVSESVLRIDHHLLVPGRDLCCGHDLVDDYCFCCCGRLAIVVDSSSSPCLLTPCSLRVSSSTQHSASCGCLSLLFQGSAVGRRESCEVVFERLIQKDSNYNVIYRGIGTSCGCSTYKTGFVDGSPSISKLTSKQKLDAQRLHKAKK